MPSAFARIARWATSGPAWSLPCYLAIALLLRLPAVLCADGYEFVDQQYQYVDPAWHLATGDAWTPTWEWDVGMRSWVYPGFLAGVFRALLWLGLEDPLWTMRGVRAVHALLSLLPAALFWLCLVRWRPVAAPRLPLLLFAGAGFVVALGVQPSGLAWGGSLAIAAVLAFHGPRGHPLLAGLLLGLAFCGRYQDALFGPALVAVGLWQRRWPAVLLLALGCVPGLLLQGFVDLATHGRFFHGPLAYFDANVVQGAAAAFKQQPWWFYLAAGVVPVAVLVPPFLGAALRTLRAGAGVLPGAAAAAALHLAAHSFLLRKALRFEYVALALLVAVLAAGFGAAAPAPGERWRLGHRRLVVAVQAALFLWASLLFSHAGPVRAAIALHGEPAFAGELLVVDGDATAVGGAFYLREQRLQVTAVPRGELRDRLRAAAATFVVAVRDDLSGIDLGGIGRLVPLGSFAGMLDLRARDRRFLYRFVR